MLLALAVATSVWTHVPTIAERIALDERLIERCNGDPTLVSCEREAVVYRQLERDGWCLGQDATYGYQRRWSRCRR